MAESGGEEQGFGSQTGGRQTCQEGFHLAGRGYQGGSIPFVGVFPQARGKRRCCMGHSARKNACFEPGQ